MSKTTEQVRKSLARRYRAERRFRAYGIISIAIGLAALAILFTDIIGKGHSAFFEHYIKLDITFNEQTLDIEDARDPEQLNYGNYDGIVREALKTRFPEVTERLQVRELSALMSIGAGYELRDLLRENPEWLGTTQTLWLLADDDVDLFLKAGEKGRQDSRMSAEQKSWITELEQAGDT